MLIGSKGNIMGKIGTTGMGKDAMEISTVPPGSNIYRVPNHATPKRG
jgi:hypothetical protein